MAKKNSYKWATTVTPFSKMLALSMLIVFPVLGFFYGMYYQKQMDDIKQSKEIVVVNTSACSQPQDGKIICNSDSECPAGYICTQNGPIVYSPGKKPTKTCWKKGHAVAL
jgi:hypothetical protein